MKAFEKTKLLSNPASVKDGFNLPSPDALAQILPIHCHFLEESTTEVRRAAGPHQKRPVAATRDNKPNMNRTYQVHHPHKRPPLHGLEHAPNAAEITNLQTKEADNYRRAMSRMADDIIVLRAQLVALEAENRRLHVALSLHRDLGRDMPSDTDLNAMTKAEVSDCIASLKFKLADETSKAASQRDRIQQLQNDLIKRTDSEKELLKLHTVRYNQEGDLHHRESCLEKMAALEATVKQQQKVIEKMEKALDSKVRQRNEQSRDKRQAVRKQRGESDRREKESEPTSVIVQQSEMTKDVLPIKDKMVLLKKLEVAEARVKTLEAQLEENSTLWGRQKQEMLTALSEHRHGFVRTATAIIHHVPAVR